MISQYRSSLKMLADVIERCPGTLWDDGTYENAYWRIVYHSLFYTSLYLAKNDDEFIPWINHKINYHRLGMFSSDNEPNIGGDSYSKAEMLDYAKAISQSLEVAVTDTNLKEESGFEWLPMNKFELHLYNIRHLQHHVGQLVERLHQVGIKGIAWIGSA
jgi:hypothetical protein